MASNYRRLPRSNNPRPRESLDGYVLNLAHRLDLTPGETMARTGLVTSPRTQVLQMGLGVRLPTANLTAFAQATGMSDHDAESLTMQRFASLTVLPRISKVRADRQWLDIRNTRYCPQCLAATTDPALPQPLWKLEWRTPWTVACAEHACVLLDACPQCDVRVGETSGGLRSLIPHIFMPVEHPASCRAKGPRGRREPMCGTRFDRAEAPTAPPILLSVQRKLDAILDGRATDLISLGMPVSPRQYLLDLRLIMVALQLACDTSRFRALPAPLSKAATAYIENRHASVGSLSRAGRTLTMPPNDHRANTALLTVADSILSDPDNAGVVNELARLAAINEPHTWSSAQARGEPSTALWAALTSMRAHTTAPAKLIPHLERSDFTFGPEHVPAYLPAPLLAKYFADLSDSYAGRIRRYVPIAILRLVGDFDSARDAGRYLGYSENAVHQATGRLSGAFPKDRVAEMRRRIVSVAQELEIAPRIDYRTPRDNIHADWSIPDERWLTLQSNLAHNRLVRSDVNWAKRRASYGIWAWSLLTAGDVTVAPMVEANPGSRTTPGPLKHFRDLQRAASEQHTALVLSLVQDLRQDFTPAN